MDLGDVGETVVLGNRIEWTIKDFFSLKPKENNIDSKYFCFKSEKFYFLLPNRNGSWLGVGLDHWSQEDFSKCSVHFSIRKRNGQETESSNAHYDDICNTFSSDQFMQWDTLEEKKDELVPDGHLTIVCHVLEEGEEPARKKSRLDSVSFRDGFKAMYQSGEHCDFDIHVQDRVFRTHKVVLAAGSSAFASMLRHDMQEKKTGMVKIDDCDSETFEAFLKFLYGWENEVIIPENVFSLYEVANKYDVQNLKAGCRRFMMENLSIELFFDVMCFSLKHEDQELNDHATEYFKLNKKHILLSEQWKNFFKENFAWANELLIKTCD